MPRVFWLVIGLLLLLNLLAIGIAIKSAGGRSYPKEASTSVIQTVDYAKLTQIINQQIAALPTPQNGSNGKNGKDAVAKDGAQGPQGAPGASIVGPQGETGPQGEAGTEGKSVEMHYNTAKAQIEWRFTGDLFWTTLVAGCTLTNTCVVL